MVQYRFQRPYSFHLNILLHKVTYDFSFSVMHNEFAVFDNISKSKVTDHPHPPAFRGGNFVANTSAPLLQSPYNDNINDTLAK